MPRRRRERPITALREMRSAFDEALPVIMQDEDLEQAVSALGREQV